jgi:hypothetical protein
MVSPPKNTQVTSLAQADRCHYLPAAIELHMAAPRDVTNGARGRVESHTIARMQTHELVPPLTRLFSELVEGVRQGGTGFVLNTGDIGLLRSLDKLSGAEASSSANGGATIAAHARHVQYGLSLMNRWAHEGGNPFADAAWDEAWKTSVVDDAEWQTIRSGLEREVRSWSEVLGSPRDVPPVALTGMISSIVHLAYHLGAIRQIGKGARGPREGTFVSP